MPIHGYICKSCYRPYEVFYTSQSAVKKEEKDERCPNPKCGSREKTRQPPTGTSFQLKGKWFKQGY